MRVEIFTSGCSLAVSDHVVPRVLSQGKPECVSWPLAAVPPPDLHFVLLVLLGKKKPLPPSGRRCSVSPPPTRRHQEKARPPSKVTPHSASQWRNGAKTGPWGGGGSSPWPSRVGSCFWSTTCLKNEYNGRVTCFCADRCSCWDLTCGPLHCGPALNFDLPYFWDEVLLIWTSLVHVISVWTGLLVFFFFAMLYECRVHLGFISWLPLIGGIGAARRDDWEPEVCVLKPGGHSGQGPPSWSPESTAGGGEGRSC